MTENTSTIIEGKESTANDSDRNVFTFHWNKHIGALTLKDVIKEVSLEEEVLKIKTTNKYIGLIGGSPVEKTLPTKNISQVNIKKMINLSDMILGIVLAVIGLTNPLFLLLAVLAFWSGVSTKIVITTKLNTKVIIPTNDKEDAVQLVNWMNNW